jgi:hypothetical protein
MSPKRTTTKKLTDTEKQEIVALYRQGGETTNSLASRFGTSGSTINRLLKSSIPESEYESIVQQKRGQKGSDADIAPIEESIAPPVVTPAPAPVVEPTPEIRYGKTVADEATEKTTEEATDKPRITRRRRSTASSDRSPDIEPELPSPVAQRIIDRQLPIEIIEEELSPITPEPSIDTDDDTEEDVTVLAAMFGEEIADDDDFGDDDFGDDEEEESQTTTKLSDDRFLKVEDSYSLRILPLSQATLPRSCYITVDKFAELVIRPLKDFAELGRIPQAEVQQRTLPIFDNQRVAKRFASNRSQRTIKIPDSRVLHKTASHLRAKGITRLLIDGQIYSID